MRLHGGVALFYNFFESTEDVPELRPYAGARFFGPDLRGWVVSNFVRLEYRAFYVKNAGEWESVWRARWQLQVKSPRFAIASSKDYNAFVSIEPFVDLGTLDGETPVDRVRTNIGLEKKVTSGLRVSLNYLFHKVGVSASGREFDLDDHVVRLRLFFNLN